MDEKVITILAELPRRFEVLDGTLIVQMRLFGSQACSDAEPGSDIDVLVVLRGDVSPCEEIARTIEDAAVQTSQRPRQCCELLTPLYSALIAQRFS
jgi:predicted nucleotidyltransferase